jgi:hypothetical protein
MIGAEVNLVDATAQATVARILELELTYIQNELKTVSTQVAVIATASFFALMLNEPPSSHQSLNYNTQAVMISAASLTTVFACMTLCTSMFLNMWGANDALRTKNVSMLTDAVSSMRWCSRLSLPYPLIDAMSTFQERTNLNTAPFHIHITDVYGHWNVPCVAIFQLQCSLPFHNVFFFWFHGGGQNVCEDKIFVQVSGKVWVGAWNHFHKFCLFTIQSRLGHSQLLRLFYLICSCVVVPCLSNCRYAPPLFDFGTRYFVSVTLLTLLLLLFLSVRDFVDFCNVFQCFC